MRKIRDLTKGEQAVLLLIVIVLFVIINNIFNDFTKSFFIPNRSAIVIGVVVFIGYIIVSWNEEIGYFFQKLRR